MLVMLILFMLCILENIEDRIHKLPKWSKLPGIDVLLQEIWGIKVLLLEKWGTAKGNNNCLIMIQFIKFICCLYQYISFSAPWCSRIWPVIECTNQLSNGQGTPVGWTEACGWISSIIIQWNHPCSKCTVIIHSSYWDLQVSKKLPNASEVKIVATDWLHYIIL